MGVWLSQVGHTPSIGVQVSSVATPSSASMVVVAWNTAFHTGLACVRRTIIQDLCAVAAARSSEGECWHGGFIHS